MTKISIKKDDGLWQAINAVTGPRGLTGINYRGTFNAATNYAINDVVTYNGVTYIAVVASVGATPNTTMTTPWTLITFGYNSRGAWVPGAQYYPGDVVSSNCSTFVNISATNSTTAPAIGAIWLLFAQGLHFVGPWTMGTSYIPGDVVLFSSGAYVNLAATNSISPVVKTTTATWGYMSGGITYVGTWNNSTAYAVNDVVSYNGSSYIAILAGTNQTPSTATGYWAVLATQGASGISPVLSVGTVTNVGTAGPPTVTMRGTAAAPILDFGLQQGARGVAGPAGSTTLGPSRSSNYTATANEVVVVNAASGNITITMPTGISANTQVVVRRIDNATANWVLLKPGSGQSVDGQAGGVYLYRPMTAVWLQYDSTNLLWRIVDPGAGYYVGNGIYPDPGSTLLELARNFGSGMTFADAAWTMVTFDTTKINTYNSLKVATADNRFTAPWTGTYEFCGQVAYVVNGKGDRVAAFGLNPSGTVGTVFGAVHLIAQGYSLTTTVPIPPSSRTLNAGDTVCLAGWQNSGGPLGHADASPYTSRLVVKFVSA